MLVSDRHRVLDAVHIGLERLSRTRKVISQMMLEVRTPGNRPATGSAAFERRCIEVWYQRQGSSNVLVRGEDLDWR